MKLQFDPNQGFQLDAVAAIADLFDGQSQSEPTFSVIKVDAAGDDLFAGQERSELGVGNRMLLDEEVLRANTRVVQTRNGIDVAVDRPLDAWELYDAPANRARRCPHFSVEMETGTGKTYVYLRTIFELAKRLGFNKYVIVVPSVAIREGTLKNLEITKDHFMALYDNIPFDKFVYDAKRVSRLRQFATSNAIEIAIINIDAFRKNFTGTEDERRSNVIFKESDRLSGRQPIEFVQAARPIVIIDEPQSVDSTERAQDAIKSLNPLCTLRYSATHRNPYNLVYRLDPVRAFELGLVKQIVVASAHSDDTSPEPYVRVDDITYKPKLQAKLEIDVARDGGGVRRRIVTATHRADLFALSNERAEYRQGWEVSELSGEPGSEYVTFANGRRLRKGDAVGGIRDDVWRVQLRHTIKRHLDREVAFAARKIKVLSLIFLDRVANYRRIDTDGHPIPGKVAQIFEQELAGLARNPIYKGLAWLSEPIERLHNGYFASDGNRLKDTTGMTQADDDVYSLIMREKERLLSIDEPLRFIFSHSALREGWDNPNVFQICTLNETRSAMKKRQEIGRGLRLPVDADGKRVFDENVNKLYVMANESYEEFARALQTEYEEDCGVVFGKVGPAAFAALSEVVDGREVPIGAMRGEAIRGALISGGMLDESGRVTAAFTPGSAGFKLVLPPELDWLAPAVTDLLAESRIERHVRRERDERPNRPKKEVLLGAEFTALWERIKPRTTYRVEFATDDLIRNAVRAIKAMARIDPPKVMVTTGSIEITRGGARSALIGANDEVIEFKSRGVPDILTYLEEQTSLTRSTLARILCDSGRLDEFLLNPQRFMDSVAACMRHELHQLVVDGIKYERLEGDHAAWEMTRFLDGDEQFVDYLNALAVEKSIYDFVPYDSEVERRFAEQMDTRADVRVFAKLPRWFTIDTPVGTYNPDWAIVLQNGALVYMVRETKGTRDFLKLRTSEADKVRCGKRHFEALGVGFDVVTEASEVTTSALDRTAGF